MNNDEEKVLKIHNSQEKKELERQRVEYAERTSKASAYKEYLEIQRQRLLSTTEQEDRLRKFMNKREPIENIEYVSEISDSKTIGSNFYLSQYLPDFITHIKKDNIYIDYSLEERKLEKEFMDSMLPIFIGQAQIQMSEKNTWINRECNIKSYGLFDYYGIFPEQLSKITSLGQTLQAAINNRAFIALKKLVNDQSISERDYGFIITKIALWVGNSVDVSEYNKLYLGLYHELSQNREIGSYADKYLAKMAFETGWFSDENLFPKENDKKTAKRI